MELAPIRAALRTGDTPQAERQRMTRDRPHILVTTPESLYILLTAARPREMLASVRTVIVDEIHAVADDKRGVAPGAHAGAAGPAGGAERHARAAAHRPLRHGEAASKTWRRF